jgi:hypothetical protein
MRVNIIAEERKSGGVERKRSGGAASEESRSDVAGTLL